MNKILLLLGGLLFFGLSFSQTIVKVDSVTGDIKGEIPFDQQFYLPVKHAKNVKLVSLRIEIYRNGKPSRFSVLDNRRARDVYAPNSTNDFRNVSNSHMTITLNEELIISTKEGSLIPIFPLAPSTSYVFRITQEDPSYSSKRRKALLDAFGKNGTLATFKNDVQKENLNDTQIADQIDTYIDKEEYGEAIQAIFLKDYYGSEKDYELIQTRISTIQKSVEDAIAKENKLASISLTEFIKNYNSCKAYLNECDSCSIIHGLYTKNISKDNLLLVLDDEHRLAIESGVLSITESANSKKCGETDYKKRIENLKETYSFIENYYKLHKHLKKNACSVDSQLLANSRKKIVGLSEIVEKWEEAITMAKAYVKAIPIFNDDSKAGYTGGGLTANSKGKFTVRPDFGVAFGSNFSDFSAAFPFVGARFNLRPLNPNLPYRYIVRKGFWHRSSIGISFTTNSIADAATRFDLVGKNNLIIDYGFRLNNAMCVSAGAIVFKQANPNPLISTQQLAVIPSLGITIDFSILEAIKDVKTVLTSL